ncbi:LysR family transcriptional regulator [Zavarzinia sp.]|uniref:LysR family transcriptional regulator n=1 Tax=Zavarzinia sp. TaxID=2027920 RepID=UPI003BB7155F
MDLNLLVVLDAIFAEGGITAAAAKLNLTQPAVSHALGRLRDVLGDPLFERQGRRLVATPFARGLIEPVRQSLRGIEIALAEAERFDPATTRRRFTLGIRDVLEARILPALMHRISEVAPLVDLSAIHVDRREVEGELAAGRVDAALDIWLSLPEHIRQRRLMADRFVVVARSGHPRVRGHIDLDTYLAQQHVLVSARTAGPGLEDIELARLGHSRHVRLRCQHYFAGCRVVSQTDMILTMTEHYARITNRPFANQMLPFPIEGPGLDAFLYWHANVENDPANRWLRGLITETMAALPLRDV